MKLNVGCGSKNFGDINCDLYVKDAGHRFKGECINPKKINNFVLCDVQYLPFKTGFFEEVICSHVIEHVKNPYLLVDEIMRVCKDNGLVRLSLPHRFSKGAKNRGHINFFTLKWFEKNLKYPFTVNTSKWSPFSFFVFFPHEINFKIFKIKKHFKH